MKTETRSSTINVWLPEAQSVALMESLPEGMTADVWSGGEQLPDSADEVEVVVLPPFGVPPERMPVLDKLPRLLPLQLDGQDPTCWNQLSQSSM